MADPARIVQLFQTPLIVDELEGADALNAELERLILAKMEEDEGVTRSNLGGWHSQSDLLAWSGEAGQRLAYHAAAMASANTVDVQPAAGQLHWQIEGWANVSRGGDSNLPHVHGGAFWSAVYYVRVGTASGGRLVLHDPRMPALRMHAPNLRFKTDASDQAAFFKPAAGRMVMFPAWLQHSVEPWGGEDVRISIAMNLRAARGAPPAGQPKIEQQATQGKSDAAS